MGSSRLTLPAPAPVPALAPVPVPVPVPALRFRSSPGTGISEKGRAGAGTGTGAGAGAGTGEFLRTIFWTAIRRHGFTLILLTSCGGSPITRSVHPMPEVEFTADLPQESNELDYVAAKRRALAILHEGANSGDRNLHLLALYGAGISLHSEAQSILLKGTTHRDGRSQMASLHYLMGNPSDQGMQAIRMMMGSEYFVARLEAAYALALSRDPMATPQVTSLMEKLDQQLRPLFPQLFAMIGDQESTRRLRILLHSPSADVRRAALIAVGMHRRDDLLPEVRTLATQLGRAQREACAHALGLLGDEESLPLLHTIADEPAETGLAAQLALYRLGRSNAAPIIAAAKKGNLYAIHLLSEIEESEQELGRLAKSDRQEVRLNASIALLKKRDVRGLATLPEFLIRDSSDLAVIEERSAGGSLTCYRTLTSAHSKLRREPWRYEMTIRERERLLLLASRLPDEAFLPLCNTLLYRGQLELVPLVIRLLELRETPEAVSLLKHHQKELAVPLVRWYCNLSLFRMGEEGPFEENLYYWVEQQSDVEIVSFREMVPWEFDPTPHELTPRENSRLLIESLEALAEKKTERAIQAIERALRSGPPENRYPIAGLLLRALV